jgi:hypothetical protein
LRCGRREELISRRIGTECRTLLCMRGKMVRRALRVWRLRMRLRHRRCPHGAIWHPLAILFRRCVAVLVVLVGLVVHQLLLRTGCGWWKLAGRHSGTIHRWNTVRRRPIPIHLVRTTSHAVWRTIRISTKSLSSRHLRGARDTSGMRRAGHDDRAHGYITACRWQSRCSGTWRHSW